MPWLLLSALVTQLPLLPRDSALHALNRLAYGPTPGQIDRVVTMGVRRWIDQQLDAQPDDDRPRRDWEARFSIGEYSTAELAHLLRDVRQARQRQARARADSLDGPGSGSMVPGAATLRHMGGQLQQLAVVRATVADHQLAEIMADFWTNHFNVFYNKSLDRVYLPSYIETTIRGHGLGRFEDLLVAVARSPAMLVYLDNALSTAPGSTPPQLGRRRFQAGRPDAPKQRSRGINENYARELLELHTVGVEGGYTQADVVDVARILTGWSVERPAEGGGFQFRDWAHDRGAKRVLGQSFPAGHGEDEGLRLLRFLANHPSTMHFVSAKLCARFVNDVPPDGCIDDAVTAWRASHGQIRSVLRAIVFSADFWSPVNVGAKIKTPLEFVVSAARALGAAPDTLPVWSATIARLGQPLFLQAVPTGYPERQDDWVNSGALLNRMNAALALAANRLPGTRIDLDHLLGSPLDDAGIVAATDRAVLGGSMSPNTTSVILREIGTVADRAAKQALAVGLALGGPEFQRQ